MWSIALEIIMVAYGLGAKDSLPREHQLEWQRLDAGKGCRIAYFLKDVSVFNEEDWPQMIEFMASNMIEFEKVMKGILGEVMKK